MVDFERSGTVVVLFIFLPGATNQYPAGNWPEYPDSIRELCTDLDLVHVVDVLRNLPRHDHQVFYTRLHGLNEDLHDYDYDYSAEELDSLAEKLDRFAGTHDRLYCMFNSYEMYENATRLLDRVE